MPKVKKRAKGYGCRQIVTMSGARGKTWACVHCAMYEGHQGEHVCFMCNGDKFMWPRTKGDTCLKENRRRCPPTK